MAMRLKTGFRALPLLYLLIALPGCGGGTQERGIQKQLVQNVPGGAPGATAHATVVQPTPFAAWLDDFKREALAQGILQPVLDNAFANVTAPDEKVLEHDQTQPEKTKSFDEYVKGFLTPKRLAAARDQWDTHLGVLSQVQKSYGVPVPIMLALWQTESRFGASQGNFPIIQSLTTLAYDGRRSAFFRKELINALLILQQEHMDAASLTGSWAGAMGQVQFMPTSFLAFAVDFDGDGRKDIWNDDADALGSMANYLHTKGWNPDIGWGIEVHVPEGADAAAWVDSKERHTRRQWQRLGLKRVDGSKLPVALAETRLVMPDGDPANAFLVTSNYDVIMDWNHSTYFATSVCLLADAIARQ